MENGCSVSRYECERKGKIYFPAFFFVLVENVLRLCYKQIREQT